MVLDVAYFRETAHERPCPSAAATEAEIRVDLAACYRLVALYGWDDLVFTHISARIPGPEHHFLINPYGLMFEEITASSLVKIDLKGEKVGDSPYPVNPAGFTIHSAVHEVREDAGCVMHLHTPDGTAVSTSKEGLLPLNQTAQLVLPDLAYHDYEGVALDLDERPRLQRDLGAKEHHAAAQPRHADGRAHLRRGVPAHVFPRARLHDAGAHAHAGRRRGRSSDRARGDREERGAGALGRARRWSREKLVWPALLRKLDRVDPGFRN